MYYFGISSLRSRDELHEDLKRIVDEAIKIIDFAIVDAYRGEREQNAAFAAGNSQKKFPNSKHNVLPAIAVDLCPYRNGLQWKDREAFYFLAGIIRAIAFNLGIKIRQGVDWDMDNNFHDQEFNDLPHLELVLDRVLTA